MSKYKITTIEELLEKHGKQRLTKILIDPNHPITRSLDERETITRNNFPFVIQKCKTTKYQDSYLQKYLRLLEKDGFTNTSKKNEKAANQQQKIHNQGFSCEICKRVFETKRGVNQHKTKMGHK